MNREDEIPFGVDPSLLPKWTIGDVIEPDQHTLDLLRQNIMARIGLTEADYALTAKHHAYVAHCLQYAINPEQLSYL